VVEKGQKRLAVPRGKQRKALMHGAHNAVVAGHLDFNKAFKRLGQGVTWPEMYGELKLMSDPAARVKGIRPQIRNPLVC
jgi:hypothetical protein